MMPTSSASSSRRATGFTLVELMVAISIFAVASLAVTSLLFATMNTNRYIRDTSDNVSQSELAFRRVVEYLRSASGDPRYPVVMTTSPYSTTDVGIATPLTKAVGSNRCTLVLEYQYDPFGHTLTEIGRWLTSTGSVADSYATVLAANVTAFSIVPVANQPSGSLLQYTVTLTIDNERPLTRESLVAVRSRVNP